MTHITALNQTHTHYAQTLLDISYFVDTGNVFGFLQHELNMFWFQALLPVVVSLVAADNYRQQS